MKEKEAIPDVLRRVPPEDFREIIEVLLGGPAKNGSLGSEVQVIDEPTEEQKQQPHTKLPKGKIALPFVKDRFKVETDWLSRDARDRTSHAMLYLGAAMDSKMLDDGKPVDCRERWHQAIKESRSLADKLIPMRKVATRAVFVARELWRWYDE